MGLLLAATEVFGAVADVGGGCFVLFDLLAGRAGRCNGKLLGVDSDGCARARRSGGSEGCRIWRAIWRVSLRRFMTGWLIQSTGSYEAPMQAIAVLLLIGAGSYALLVNNVSESGDGHRHSRRIADSRRRPGSRRSRRRRFRSLGLTDLRRAACGPAFAGRLR